MKYQRPKSDLRLTKSEKIKLMDGYVAFYKKQYDSDSETLNRKIPREVFADIINAIGSLLVEKTAQLATSHGLTSKFLNDTPLPPSMHDLLSRETRAFCLGLNALKQWVAAEQSAMDRLILGGSVREICREAAPNCLVTGQPLDIKNLDLHHPVRDGRPPIPLSKAGHAKLEKQNSSDGDETMSGILSNLKRKGHCSWVMLRKGCLDLLGQNANHTKKSIGENSKTFARNASRATGKSFEELLQWLDESKK